MTVTLLWVSVLDNTHLLAAVSRVRLFTNDRMDVGEILAKNDG